MDDATTRKNQPRGTTMTPPQVDWMLIANVPEGIEVLVTGGVSIMGGRPLGRRVAIIDDRADLYRMEDGKLRATSPTMWTILPLPPVGEGRLGEPDETSPARP